METTFKFNNGRDRLADVLEQGRVFLENAASELGPPARGALQSVCFYAKRPAEEGLPQPVYCLKPGTVRGPLAPSLEGWGLRETIDPREGWKHVISRVVDAAIWASSHAQNAERGLYEASPSALKSRHRAGARMLAACYKLESLTPAKIEAFEGEFL